MANLESKLSKLKDAIAGKKALKKVAEDKIEELRKTLEQKGIKPEKLSDKINEMEKELEDLEKKITNKIEEASSVIERSSE